MAVLPSAARSAKHLSVRLGEPALSPDSVWLDHSTSASRQRDRGGKCAGLQVWQHPCVVWPPELGSAPVQPCIIVEFLTEGGRPVRSVRCHAVMAIPAHRRPSSRMPTAHYVAAHLRME